MAMNTGEKKGLKQGQLPLPVYVGLREREAGRGRISGVRRRRRRHRPTKRRLVGLGAARLLAPSWPWDFMAMRANMRTGGKEKKAQEEGGRREGRRREILFEGK
jgi:hypothetical protein